MEDDNQGDENEDHVSDDVYEDEIVLDRMDRVVEADKGTQSAV